MASIFIFGLITQLLEVPDPAQADVISTAIIQLVGSGGIGALLVFGWTLLRTKLEDINKADIALEQRIETLDRDLGGRLDDLQREIARKANTDSVTAIEGRLEIIERHARERSRRLTLMEARAGLHGPIGGGVGRPSEDVPRPR